MIWLQAQTHDPLQGFWSFCTTMNYRKIIERLEDLSVDKQDDLFELIRKRRVEQRGTEIAAKG